jgi:hypothetical protein
MFVLDLHKDELRGFKSNLSRMRDIIASGGIFTVITQNRGTFAARTYFGLRRNGSLAHSFPDKIL